MNVANALREGRRAAESRMTLILAVHQPAPTSTDPDDVVLDEDGFESRTTLPAETVRGRITGGSAQGDMATRYVTIGNVERPVLSGGLHIPLSAPMPVASSQRGIGWEYEVTAVGPVDDPALLGCRFLVVGAPMKAQATARRLDVVQIH